MKKNKYNLSALRRIITPSIWVVLLFIASSNSIGEEKAFCGMLPSDGLSETKKKAELFGKDVTVSPFKDKVGVIYTSSINDIAMSVTLDVAKDKIEYITMVASRTLHSPDEWIKASKSIRKELVGEKVGWMISGKALVVMTKPQAYGDHFMNQRLLISSGGDATLFAWFFNSKEEATQYYSKEVLDLEKQLGGTKIEVSDENIDMFLDLVKSTMK